MTARQAPAGAATVGEAAVVPAGDTYKPETPSMIAHRLGMRNVRTTVTNDELVDLAVTAYWRNRHRHIDGEAA